MYDIGRDLCVCYGRLYKEAFDQNKKWWKMPPKTHLVQELLMYQVQEHGNPAYYWCYPDEDLVGLMIEIGRSCHRRNLPSAAIVKWLVTAFDCDSDEEDDE